MPNLPKVETLSDTDLSTLLSQIQAEQSSRATQRKQATTFASSPQRLASMAEALHLQMPTPQVAPSGNGHKAKPKTNKKLKSAKAVQRAPAIPVRYRDPANAANTWSGRGKPAKWITDAIGQGRAKSIEDFRVKN